MVSVQERERDILDVHEVPPLALEGGFSAGKRPRSGMLASFSAPTG